METDPHTGRPETPLRLRRDETDEQMLPQVDPVLVGIVTILLLIVFAVFLFIRRTVTGFTEGMREGRRR